MIMKAAEFNFFLQKMENSYNIWNQTLFDT